MDYLYEVGATQDLVSSYLSVCRSCTFRPALTPILEPEPEHDKFIDWFLSQLSQQMTTYLAANDQVNLFWTNVCSFDSIQSDGTFEDYLYTILIHDMGSKENGLEASLSKGMRVKLENCCLKFLQLAQDKLKNVKKTKSLCNQTSKTFDAIQRLYIKVRLLHLFIFVGMGFFLFYFNTRVV